MRTKSGIIKGNQRYRDKGCGCNYTVSPLSRTPIDTCIKSACVGFRGIFHLTGVAHTTVMGWVHTLNPSASWSWMRGGVLFKKRCSAILSDKILPKAFISWSSGKDCAFAMVETHRLGLADIVGMLTTINEAYDRVVQHGTRSIRTGYWNLQIEALGLLPCMKVGLPADCTMVLYEQRIMAAFEHIKAQGVEVGS